MHACMQRMIESGVQPHSARITLAAERLLIFSTEEFCMSLKESYLAPVGNSAGAERYTLSLSRHGLIALRKQIY